MFTFRVDSLDGPNLQLTAIRHPEISGHRLVRTYGYNTYLRATGSNPQYGDLIDVAEDGRILGLHLEDRS